MCESRASKRLGVRNDGVGLAAARNEIVRRIDSREAHLVLVPDEGLQRCAGRVDVPQFERRVDRP